MAGRPPKLNDQQVRFIQAYIADPEHKPGPAALAAGYSRDKEGFRLLKQPLVREAIARWRQQEIDAAIEASEITAADHIRILEEQVAALLHIKQARSQKYGHIPGGKSGMITERVRYFGQGDHVRSFTEHTVDNGTNKELRETLRQIAIMRGEWVEKAENKNIGAGAGQIIITEIVVEQSDAAQQPAPDAIETTGQVVE
jgi:hypothetical protein